jgi:hypothetical protein
MTFAEYLATAPADEFFWWAAIPAVLALAGLVAGYVFLYRKRLIEDMPTSRLRSAAQGYIEVEGIGRLMDGTPIICPLTATRCLWWRYHVERKEKHVDSRGQSRTSWATIERAASDDSFVLDDGTATCIVDPTGASVVPSVRRRWYGHRAHPDVGWEHGRGFWRAAFCEYRYTEELMLERHAVYGLGSYRTQAGQPDSFDERADLSELLDKWKHNKAMMALLDVNKDGTVDQKEWEAARRMAREKVRQEHVARAVTTSDLNILAKPRDKRPYILSGIPQAQLVRRYRLSATASFAAMAVAGVLFVWALHLRGIVA